MALTVITSDQISTTQQFSLSANLVMGNVTMTPTSFVVGNSTVNTSLTAGLLSLSGQTVNSTVFTGLSLTANNSSYLGGTAASGYQTTAGLSANVATLTSNNSSYLGGTAAASFVQNTDSRTLSGNLNFTGSNTYFSGVATHAANVILSSTVGVSANGGFGSNGQALTTNGSAVYWSTIVGVNTAAQYTFTNTITFPASTRINTNGDVGIHNTTPRATLDVYSNDSIILPVGNTGQRSASAVSGMLRFNGETSAIESYDGSKWFNVASTFSATGATSTLTVGSYTYYIFTSSGTFTVTKGSAQATAILVAGGGAGGWDVGGGGGAGGLLYQSVYLTPTSYSIVIGAGGTGPTSATSAAFSGSNTTAFGLTAIGGGGGGGWSGGDGASGGSGGGCSSNRGTTASGTSGQGTNGGTGGNNTSPSSNEYSGASGGGGATVAGGNGIASGWSAGSTTYGYGGNGQVDSNLGNILSATGLGTLEADGFRWIAGGGGASSDGGSYWGVGGKGGGARGSGGTGGGGSNATVNTGGGGGGAGGPTNTGGNGGSGIVIIRV